MKIIRLIDFIFSVLLPSLIFNFHYLPFRQAWKLPIYVRKPKFRRLGGQVILDCLTLERGMIKLGWHYSDAWPDNGISWHNEGKVVFRGRAAVGSDTYFLVLKTGNVEIGDGFRAAGSIKIVSACGICFGKEARIGWSTIIMDTNCHPLFDVESQRMQKGFGEIKIGDNNWFGTGCLVVHSVVTPQRAVFAARTVVTHSGCKIMETYAVHGGEPLRVLKRNVMRREDREQFDYVNDKF